MKQQIRTPCGKPIRYAWKTPHKFLEKFSKNLYGTTAGTYSLRFLRPVMLKCTENELKQRMSRYCGQSYIWGMNNRVKCFQKFPKDVYSLYSLLICRDGSRYWTGFLSFNESGRSKHSTCEEKVSEFHFYISLKSISVYCFSLPCIFFSLKEPFYMSSTVNL